MLPLSYWWPGIPEFWWVVGWSLRQAESEGVSLPTCQQLAGARRQLWPWGGQNEARGARARPPSRTCARLAHDSCTHSHTHTTRAPSSSTSAQPCLFPTPSSTKGTRWINTPPFSGCRKNIFHADSPGNGLGLERGWNLETQRGKVSTFL